MASDELFEAILKDLHIEKEPTETEMQFSERVLYSVGSAWFRVLMREEDGMPSLSRVQRRLSKKYEFLVKACPSLAKHISIDTGKLAEQVIVLHKTIGTVFHAPRYISPVPEAVRSSDGIKAFRCGLPGEEYHYSGQGIFQPDDSVDPGMSIYDIYGFDLRSIDEIADMILRDRKWNRIENIAGILYLNTNRHAGEPLYIPQKPEGSFILARSKANDSQRLTYYLMHNSQFSTMSDWEVLEGYHRILAIYLCKHWQSPLATAKYGKCSIDLQLHFPLPKADELMLQFWAWPKNLQSYLERKNSYLYSVERSIWPIFHNRLCQIGYAVKEKK